MSIYYSSCNSVTYFKRNGSIRKPEGGGVDVGGEIDCSRVPLPDAFAQLVERRVQKGANIGLRQL